MYKKLNKRFRDLEMEVFATLRDLITNSPIVSTFTNTPVIKVNVFDYVEMAIINDEHVFFDHNGLQYDLYSECSLEDLIDILNQID